MIVKISKPFVSTVMISKKTSDVNNDIFRLIIW